MLTPPIEVRYFHIQNNLIVSILSNDLNFPYLLFSIPLNASSHHLPSAATIRLLLCLLIPRENSMSK